MSPYHWSATHQVVERLLQVRGGRQRQKLTDFFDHLAAHPEKLRRGQFTDEEGNVYHLAAFEYWLITYHLDLGKSLNQNYLDGSG